MAITDDLRSRGYVPAMIAWAAGVLPASPAATVARAKNSWMKFCAKPLTAVARLQSPSDAAMTQRGLERSAMRAMPTPAKE